MPKFFFQKKHFPIKLFIIWISSVSMSFVVLAVLLQYALNSNKNFSLSGSCKNCNVVIIDIDVLRADAIDCKNKYNNTPNICRFANNSVYFQSNISQSYQTFPSFVSFMTSLYPVSHNMNTPFRDHLNNAILTLSALFKNNGYKTIFIGPTKSIWLIYDGFDSIINYPSLFNQKNSLTQLVNGISLNQPFLLYIYSPDIHDPYLLPENITNQILLPKLPAGIDKKIPKNREEQKKNYNEYIIKYYIDIFSPEAINRNKNIFQNTGANKDKIIDLYYGYLDTKNYAMFKDVWKPYRESYFRYIDINNPIHINYLKSNYYTSLNLVDQELSALFLLLNSEEVAKNTIVIIRSDHGEEFMEHGKILHEDFLYQELIHTPLIIKIPYAQPARIKGFSQDIDVFPTLLDLIGIAPIKQLQGKSLVPLMENNKIAVNDYQISQQWDNTNAIFRKGDWKLFIQNEKPFMLFNLAIDPGEKNNVLKSHIELAGNMLKEYKQILDPLKKYSSNPTFPDWIDPEKRKRLIKEGYF